LFSERRRCQISREARVLGAILARFQAGPNVAGVEMLQGRHCKSRKSDFIGQSESLQNSVHVLRVVLDSVLVVLGRDHKLTECLLYRAAGL
jgi:hypothetical protein